MSTESDLKPEDLPPLNAPGKAKAAIFLVFLGSENTGPIMQALSDSEIETLTIEIAKHKKITPEERLSVLFEFEHMMMARKFASEGGLEYAKVLLEKTLGPGRALEILAKMGTSLHLQPFEAARTADPSQLATLIQNEHPQTIALIMAYLQPEKAGVVLQSMDHDSQLEIAKRLALMDRTSPEITRQLESYLEEKLSFIVGQDLTTAGGIDSVIKVLNSVERATEKTIIETMEVQEPVLAEEIKKKMFVFEDVVLIDDRGMQRLFKDIDQKDLSLALKGVTDEVKDKFFKNMSKRAAEMLREDMQYMGSVRMRDVDQAQQRIVAIIRRLEDEGALTISKGGDDEIIA